MNHSSFLFSSLIVLHFINLISAYGGSAYAGGERAPQLAPLSAALAYGSPQLTRFIQAAPMVGFSQPGLYEPISPPYCRCNTQIFRAPVCANDGATYNSVCDLVNAMAFSKSLCREYFWEIDLKKLLIIDLGYRCDTACPCKFDSNGIVVDKL